MTTKRMASVGDNVVDLYTGNDMLFPGGGAVNVAVHARRNGWGAAYVGVVGSDDAGAFVLDALDSEGVDTRAVHITAEPNAVTEIAIDDDGNRRFTAWTPVATPIRITPDADTVLRSATWLYTNYASRTEGLLPELAAYGPVVFDFSYRDLDYADPLLPSVAFAVFSRDALDDIEVLGLIDDVKSRSDCSVLVTRGAGGAVIAHADTVHWQDAVPTVPTDTLGAGDAFLARLVCGLFEGEDIAGASAAAAAAAAAVCRHAGAFGRGRAMTVSPKKELR